MRGEIAQAIGILYAECQRSIACSLCQTPERLDLEYAYDLAVRVLREKLLEKPKEVDDCNYCMGKAKSDCADWTVFDKHADCIQYCPMCGRRLTDDKS